MAAANTPEDSQGTTWTDPHADAVSRVKIKKAFLELHKLGQVFFPTNSHELDAADKEHLEGLSKDYSIILLGDKINLYFVGYADYRGSRSHNLQLTEKRAAEVADFFKQHPRFKESQNWDGHIEAKGEEDSPQPGNYYKGIKVRRGRDFNTLNLLKAFRRVDIYTDTRLRAPAVRKHADLTVIVKDAEGKPFSNITITIQGPDSEPPEATNAEGKAKFDDITTGDYEVTATDRAGYKVSEPAQVSPDKYNLVKIEMPRMMKVPKEWAEYAHSREMDVGDGKTHWIHTNVVVVDEYEFVHEQNTVMTLSGPFTKMRGSDGLQTKWAVSRYTAHYRQETSGDIAKKYVKKMLDLFGWFQGNVSDLKATEVHESWDKLPEGYERLRQYGQKD